MWWRRSWFSLKGKAGIPGQTEGRPATSIGPRVPPVGSLQQRGVGLHVSLKDLLAVRTIAVPGAVGQIALVTLLGFGLVQIFGWEWGAGVVFGLALSVASTVVVLRALQDRRLIETERGRIVVGLADCRRPRHRSRSI